MGDENQIVRLPLSALREHPMNANVMPDDLFEKLVGHIERTGQYPPLIVRYVADREGYEVLDGHHRWKALRRLRKRKADCVVWAVDDTQSLVLMSTLNRLQGADDPRKRGALLAELEERLESDRSALSAMLPESGEAIRKLLAAREAPPEPTPPPLLSDMPAGVCFFLNGRDRGHLDRALERIGGTRESALMEMVFGYLMGPGKGAKGGA